MSVYIGENADSLALLTAEYRAAGCEGQHDDDVVWGRDCLIPVRLLKPETDSIAQRYIGREIARETKRFDERELRRAYNRKGD